MNRNNQTKPIIITATTIGILALLGVLISHPPVSAAICAGILFICFLSLLAATVNQNKHLQHIRSLLNTPPSDTAEESINTLLRENKENLEKRITAERKYDKAEERIQLSSLACKEGFWDLDLKNKTTYFSLQFYRLLGYKDQEFPSSLDAWKDLLHPADREFAVEQLECYLSGLNREYEAEFRMLCKNGSTRWFLSRGKIISKNEDQQPERMIGALLDITDRKISEERQTRLEQELFQAQKMEAVGQMAGGVAHDFNNLLTVIVNCAQFARDEISDTSKAANDIEEIIQASKRASELTGQLLAFSRRQELKMKPVKLQSLLKKMQTMLSRLIPEDIDLKMDDCRALKPVKADPIQLEHVLLNLVSNAKDALSSEGYIHILAKNTHLKPDDTRIFGKVEGFTPGEYVELIIKDNGKGMSQGVIARIFDPFFTTKEKGKGTGLGLSTVYGIIRQHRGFINIDSSLGKGTAFHIFLPVLDATTETGVEQRGKTSLLAGGSETILAVEDETVVRKIAVRMLKKLGYNVLEAENGRHAVDIIESKDCSPINLVMTDMIMPQMDGKKLAEYLRKHHPDVAILFVSGYSGDRIEKLGGLKENEILLNKPFSIELLSKAIRKAIDENNTL